MKITASAERRIDAPAGRVYAYIRDFREHHPKFLPSQFSNLVVESGGIGAGTVVSFDLTLGGRTRSSRIRVGEPEPGRVLIESDPSRRLLTTFTVDATPDGASIVRIDTVWHADGLGGIVERLLAPRMLRRLYHTELTLLDRYAAHTAAPVAHRRPKGRGVVAIV
jgi:hypothetical protein